MAQLPLNSDIQQGGMLDGDVYTAFVNYKTAINELKALVNQLRNYQLYAPLANPGFAISTNFDVKNANAISYLNGGTLKTLSANTNFDTGTTATIATTKWNAALLSVNSSGTAVLTWAAASAASFASEALAIAGLAAAATTDTVLGYVTVQAAGVTWTPGTDALTTGTGGTAANATNYYNLINPNATLFGAAASETLVLTKG